MAQSEIAKAVVDLDGRQAEDALNSLKKQAKELRDALKEAEKAGDFQSAKKLRTEISLNTKEQRAFKQATREVNIEMEKLNGMSFNQLKKSFRELKKARDDAKPNTAEWKKYNDQMGQVKNQMDKVGGSMGKTNKAFLSLKNLLPALGIGAAITMLADLGKQLFKLAIQLEGDNRRATIVFGDSLKYVEQQAASLSKQMGLTNKEFVAAAANTADLLIPLDFTRETAAKMSVELQSLAGALDEWTGGRIGAAEVSNILTKAMLGENEQLKQLGIAIRKDTDEFRDLVKVHMEAEGVTKAQAEAMATLELIQKKSADAQTAYNLEGNKLLRWQKQASRWWKQLKEDVVTYFDVQQSEKLQKEQNSLNLLVNSIISVNDNQKIRNKLIEDLQKTYPKFLGNLDAEKVSNDQLLSKLKEVNDEYRNRIRIAVYEEELTAIEEKNKDIFRLQKSHVEYINELYDKHIKDKKEGLSLEQKLSALINDELDYSTLAVDEMTTAADAVQQIRFDAQTSQREINRLSQKEIELEQEYQELMLKRAALQVATANTPDEQAKAIAAFTTEIEKVEQTIQSINNIGLEDAILSDEDAEALQEKLGILNPGLEYLRNLFGNPEEEPDDTIGGAISKFLFGQDWSAMSLSQKIAAVGTLVVSTLSDINKIVTNIENQQLLDFQNNIDKRKERLNAQLNNDIISYEQYTARTAQLDAELDKKKRKIAHDQAVRSRSLAIMQAVVNTAAGVTQMLNNPWPLNLILAALVGVLGGIQVGIAASQPIPQYASGNYAQITGAQDGKTYNARVTGSNHRSGLYSEPTYVPGFGLFGETQQPELVFNPYDTQKIIDSPALIDAINHTISPQFAAGNSTQVINGQGGGQSAIDTARQTESMDRFAAAVEMLVNNGVQAKLVADEDYNRTHNDSASKYNKFQQKVN